MCRRWSVDPCVSFGLHPRCVLYILCCVCTVATLPLFSLRSTVQLGISPVSEAATRILLRFFLVYPLPFTGYARAKQRTTPPFPVTPPTPLSVRLVPTVVISSSSSLLMLHILSTYIKLVHLLERPHLRRRIWLYSDYIYSSLCLLLSPIRLSTVNSYKASPL